MPQIAIIQEQRLPVHTAEKQIVFLNHILQLIRLAETTSTYKFALLLSITRLAIEQGEASGNTLTLKIEDIAEKFIELYWNQARPFHFKDTDEFILKQNNGSAQAAVISNIIKEQQTYKTISSARSNPKTWNSLNKRIVKIIKDNPLERLQIINRVNVEFLYRLEDCTNDDLTLLPDVMFCLRSFNIIIEELCQKAWVDTVRLHKDNRFLLDSLPDLDTFLFETSRKQLIATQPILIELQENRCFYCGKKISDGKISVDHFIPWSLYQVDTGHNFVLTDSTCNTQKSNLLASERFRQLWLERNLLHDDFITEEMRKIGFIADKNRSERIADWAYGLIPEKDHWTPANQQDRKG